MRSLDSQILDSSSSNNNSNENEIEIEIEIENNNNGINPIAFQTDTGSSNRPLFRLR